MADPILLVQGDSPTLRVNLTRDDTGSAIDVTDATVKLHFRKKSTDNLLFTVEGSSNSGQATGGIVDFQLSSSQLTLAAGGYEAEVEILFDNGNRETVYELIDFNLREDFA